MLRSAFLVVALAMACTPDGAEPSTSAVTGESSDGTAAGTSATGGLPVCQEPLTECANVGVGPICECPGELSCTANLPNFHVSTCLECDCPAGTICRGDGLGDYVCEVDEPPGDSSTGTAGSSTGDGSSSGGSTGGSSGTGAEPGTTSR